MGLESLGGGEEGLAARQESPAGAAESLPVLWESRAGEMEGLPELQGSREARNEEKVPKNMSMYKALGWKRENKPRVLLVGLVCQVGGGLGPHRVHALSFA